MPDEKLKTLNETDHEHDHGDHQEEINWLGGEPGRPNGWETVTLKGDMEDRKQRKAKERIIKAYIRGWLELYNDENKTNHKVTKVEIRNNYGGDTRFTVKAYIDPPPRPDEHAVGGAGGHLIPPEPTPIDTI